MGQSTNAILTYGIDMGEMGDDQIEELERLVSASSAKLELVRHCSHTCSMIILAAANMTYESNRGYPIETSMDVMVTPLRDDYTYTQFRNFFAQVPKESEWDYVREFQEQQPSWLLASFWGC